MYIQLLFSMFLVFLLTSLTQQVLRAFPIPFATNVSKYISLMDFILNYGEFLISQSCEGHNMISVATVQSTMDFSTKPIDVGVVNSPPNGRKKLLPVNSPSPLKLQVLLVFPRLHSTDQALPQRKLYVDDKLALLVHKV